MDKPACLRSKVAFALIVLALTGCTQYGDMGFMGFGVEHVQIAQDVYRVRARGNGYTNPARIEEFVLLRASELALAQGYPHFVVMDTRELTRTDNYAVPGYSDTNTSSTVQRYGTSSRLGGMTSSSGLTSGESSKRTTTLPAQTFGIQIPELQVVVKLLKTGEGGPGTVYDAAIIKSNLGPKLM